jgi:DNA-binding transcriptional LysR family regulator
MRSLNLDQLRALTEVVALGSFSAAARRLNLTQPAISLQIRELEARWGLRLIERMGKKAQATPAGRELIEHAQRIARECESAEATMRGLRDGWLGRVHISATLTALMYDLPSVLRRLRMDHPRIELVVTNMATRDSIDKIIQSTIDFGLVTLPVKSALLRTTPLRAQTCVAIFPAATRDLPDEVTPEFVARQSIILEHDRGAVHALVMRWLAKRLPLARQPMYVGIIEAAKQAVAAGLGMSIVPDVAVSAPSREIIVRPLKPALPCILGLIERRSRSTGAALEIVRDSLLALRTIGTIAEFPHRAKRARASVA